MVELVVRARVGVTSGILFCPIIFGSDKDPRSNSNPSPMLMSSINIHTYILCSCVLNKFS